MFNMKSMDVYMTQRRREIMVTYRPNLAPVEDVEAQARESVYT